MLQGHAADAALHIRSDIMHSVLCMRDFGIYINSDVSVQTPISRTVKLCHSLTVLRH